MARVTLFYPNQTWLVHDLWPMMPVLQGRSRGFDMSSWRDGPRRVDGSWTGLRVRGRETRAQCQRAHDGIKHFPVL